MRYAADSLLWKQQVAKERQVKDAMAEYTQSPHYKMNHSVRFGDGKLQVAQSDSNALKNALTDNL